MEQWDKSLRGLLNDVGGGSGLNIGVRREEIKCITEKILQKIRRKTSEISWNSSSLLTCSEGGLIE